MSEMMTRAEATAVATWLTDTQKSAIGVVYQRLTYVLATPTLTAGEKERATERIEGVVEGIALMSPAEPDVLKAFVWALCGYPDIARSLWEHIPEVED